MDTAGIEPATARRSRELSCETGIIPLNQAPWLMLVGQPPIKILGLINLTNLIIPLAVGWGFFSVLFSGLLSVRTTRVNWLPNINYSM